MSKIATKWIEDDAVTAAKLGGDVAGSGITQAVGGALDINVDDSTVEIDTDTLQIKDLGVSAAKLGATSVTAAKLGSDVAGNGLTGGNGSAIAAQEDSTGGSNLATVMSVTANGLAVKIDDSTIDENGSNQLIVKSSGITETQLSTSVAGAGISGGGGTALALDIDELTAETSAANDDTIAIYDTSATAVRKMTRSDFLEGVGTGETVTQEMHKVTSGETTNGYFTLGGSPSAVSNVRVTPVYGPTQVNKQVVGSTGVTPDFDVLSSNQLHFNNNGAATGLSEHITTDDVLIIEYSV